MVMQMVFMLERFLERNGLRERGSTMSSVTSTTVATPAVASTVTTSDTATSFVATTSSIATSYGRTSMPPVVSSTVTGPTSTSTRMCRRRGSRSGTGITTTVPSSTAIPATGIATNRNLLHNRHRDLLLDVHRVRPIDRNSDRLLDHDRTRRLRSLVVFGDGDLLREASTRRLVLMLATGGRISLRWALMGSTTEGTSSSSMRTCVGASVGEAVRVAVRRAGSLVARITRWR